MGYYVNPTDGSTKEQYLQKNGEQLGSAPKWSDIPEDKVAICLAGNGMFGAAGVMYSERELEYFKDPSDTRPKKWYLISKDAAIAASDWNG